MAVVETLEHGRRQHEDDHLTHIGAHWRNPNEQNVINLREESR